MTQVSIEEVVAKLQILLNEVLEGREILITQNDRPVAKLVSVKGCKSKAAVLTAFCSSPVSLARLLVKMSAMRKFMRADVLRG